jgi:hypothetical protein
MFMVGKMCSVDVQLHGLLFCGYLLRCCTPVGFSNDI